ncbi:MAG: YkgJ family cysteine cluster protein [Crocinitomicaceae bacterium]|nr:YkgJ family cysteine cluster protein [Crocinitomicaceae bacterium]
MKQQKTLSPLENLPLTCTRSGTCCHGNQVLINPWELGVLAQKINLTPSKFKELHTEFGGIRLKFNGKTNNLNKQSCNLYSEKTGCSVHENRPLVCRLFPLGRKIQENNSEYFFEGDQLPCLNECPDILLLPSLTVEKYLEEQKVKKHELAQDAYLEVTQNLADLALTLLLDTNLTKEEQAKTIQKWRYLGKTLLNELHQSIDKEFIEYILTPKIKIDEQDPIKFIEKHNELLQVELHNKYSIAKTSKDLINVCVQTMNVSLFIASSIGANTLELSEHWIEIAHINGVNQN